MNLKKLAKAHGQHLSILCAVIAVLLFLPACTATELVWKVFFSALVILLLAAGGVLLFFWNRTREFRVHYFLYDPETGNSISEAELTPARCHACMDRYLAPFGVRAEQLFADFPPALRKQLNSEPAFRPALMYRMLRAMAEYEGDEIYRRFTAASPRAVSYLCCALNDADDGELADFIYDLKKNAAGEQSHVPPFFKRNAARFDARILKYVERNFEHFFVEKSRFTNKERASDEN